MDLGFRIAYLILSATIAGAPVNRKPTVLLDRAPIALINLVDDSPCVTRVWNFGDPSSKAANRVVETGLTGQRTGPRHIFSHKGQYAVMMTCTDVHDMSSTVVYNVVVSK